MTTGTTTWIDQTAAAVDQASDQVRAEQRIEELNERLDSFTTLVADLEKLRDAAELPGTDWWPPGAVPGTLLQALRNCIQKPDTRPLVALDRELTAFTASIKGAVMTAWRAEVQTHVAELESWRELAAALPASSGFGGALDDVVHLLARLRTIGKSLPTPDGLTALNQSKALRRSLAPRLPVKVRAFVEAATSPQGASIDALDNEILSWMRHNGATQSFWIVAGPGGGARG